MSFDDWGRKFVSGNSQPLEMVFFEDRYAARTPFHAMPPSRGSIAVGGGAAEVFRASPVEAWRELRTKMRMANPKLGPVEGGGRAAGYFTGATGVTACRGDAYPDEMRECLVVGDVGSNLVHRERLSARGPFLEARRIDQRSELVASSDIWFRPAQFANAPDGTLHILDRRFERLLADIAADREILETALQHSLTVMSHRTNQTMNRLAVVSTIFLPLTFLCGVYGMNFEIMPEIEWENGYTYFWILSGVITVTLIIVLRRARLL